EEPAARLVAVAAFAPYLDDAIDVAPDVELEGDVRKCELAIHRHAVAHGEKAGVHLGADGSGPGSRGAVLRPEFLFPKPFGHVLGDGKAVPDHDLVVDQHRNPADGRVALHPLLEVGGIETDFLLVERDAWMLQKKPGSERPARVILVPDDEFHGAVSMACPPVQG